MQSLKNGMPQDESPKAIAIAVTKTDGLSSTMVWGYALIATAMAWALMQLHL